MYCPILTPLVVIRGWNWMLPRLKLLPLAVLNGLPLPWTFRRLDGWRLLAAQNHPIGVDCARPGATHAKAQESPIGIIPAQEVPTIPGPLV